MPAQAGQALRQALGVVPAGSRERELPRTIRCHDRDGSTASSCGATHQFSGSARLGLGAGDGFSWIDSKRSSGTLSSLRSVLAVSLRRPLSMFFSRPSEMPTF